MAAAIENVRTGAREVNGGRFGRLVIELTPAGLISREKGRRTRYGPVSFEQLHVYLAELHARQERAEKRRTSRVSRGLLTTEK